VLVDVDAENFALVKAGHVVDEIITHEDFAAMIKIEGVVD
jgi:hypothetical protein